MFIYVFLCAQIFVKIMFCPLSLFLYITIFIISGDDILSVNGMAVQGMSHSEAISIFKNIKIGFVTLYVARRDSLNKK